MSEEESLQLLRQSLAKVLPGWTIPPQDDQPLH